MASESGSGQEGSRVDRKLVVAVEDESLRDHLSRLVDPEVLRLEVVDAGVDPLQAPPDQVADLLIVRRTSVRPQDLRDVDSYASKEDNPGLVVLTEDADEQDRAHLLSAGALGVIEASEGGQELGEAVAALAGAEGGAPRDPLAGREDSEPRLVDFLSRSPRMRRFLDLVQRVIDTDSSLMITGETGVGKERLAQAIHNDGPRRDGPFVAVNCGAIPEALLESELFGHEEGAFTGASRRKKGRFELAEGGTIFLDEIGEMPLHLQVNLLSVLQRRRVQRVGADSSIPVDVRVMAATHRDMQAEVRTGRFREDLYYRLNVVTLEIPPLRERPEDIPELVGSFIRHFRVSLGRPQVDSIEEDALDALLSHAWPGNVRQLQNAIEHAIVLCRGTRIGLEDLPDSVTETPELEGPPPGSGHGGFTAEVETWTDRPLREARRAFDDEFERAYLDALLRRTAGRVGRTAELAGITPRSLYDKMKRHGLDKDDYRP